MNADKTIWHLVDVHGPVSGEKGNKTAWLRPWGAPLTITGRRLDGESSPLRADIPGGYRTGLQIAGVYFPTAGCWEATATAANSVLTFVTQVH